MQKLTRLDRLARKKKKCPSLFLSFFVPLRLNAQDYFPSSRVTFLVCVPFFYFLGLGLTLLSSSLFDAHMLDFPVHSP